MKGTINTIKLISKIISAPEGVQFIKALSRIKGINATEDDDLVTLAQLKAVYNGVVLAEEDNVLTGFNTFEQPVIVPDATHDDEATNLAQVLLLISSAVPDQEEIEVEDVEGIVEIDFAINDRFEKFGSNPTIKVYEQNGPVKTFVKDFSEFFDTDAKKLTLDGIFGNKTIVIKQ